MTVDVSPLARPVLRSARRPALLVSLHDVSPLTLTETVEAWALVQRLGVPPAALALLVIPFHEGRAPLDTHPETVAFLKEAAACGATLVQHGLTHRLPRPLRDPRRWAWGYGFARGQGELYGLGEVEAAHRLAEGRAILERVGLGQATRAFVPPAWLLSRDAARAVDAMGFRFVEYWDGVRAKGRGGARRVMGWGSLSRLEAWATSLWAALQSRLPAVDMRLAVHPADMRSAITRRSLERLLPRLCQRHDVLGYDAFLSRLV